MKTSVVELLRCCPFCGSHEVEVCRTNGNACWVRCSVCGAESQSHAIRQRAVELWNRRYHDDVPSTITDDQDAADVASKANEAKQDKLTRASAPEKILADLDNRSTFAVVEGKVAAAQDTLI